MGGGVNRVVGGGVNRVVGGGVNRAVGEGVRSSHSLVHSAGCSPRSMAAFSAGSPKASQPMGCSTWRPCMRW